MANFFKQYYKLIILVLIFSTFAFSWFLSKITDTVKSFNENVVSFVPTELLFIFPLVAIWMMFQIYHSVKS